MADAWQAEFELDEPMARRLIESQFPQLTSVQLQHYGQGWDNTAFLVNDRWVFRFPRRAVAAPAIRYEMEILPKIAPHLPLAIPNPTFLGKPALGYPWSFAGYEKLAGHLACSARLTPAERTDLAEPLGAFLATLHRQITHFDVKRLPPDGLGRNDYDKVRTRIEKYLPLAKPFLSNKLFQAIQRYMNRVPEFSIQRDSLVHGDLYVRHLLLDQQKQLAGVIDWGDSMLGDPGIDMALAWTFLPPSAHDIFKAAYGPMRDDSWRFACCFSLIYGLILTQYAHAEKDDDLRFESEFMLNCWLDAHGST